MELDLAEKNLQKRKDSLFKERIESDCRFYSLGSYLKSQRLEAHFTQKQIANKVRTTKNFISRLENHTCDVRLSTLCKYAKALGKHIDIKLI